MQIKKTEWKHCLRCELYRNERSTQPIRWRQWLLKDGRELFKEIQNKGEFYEKINRKQH